MIRELIYRSSGFVNQMHHICELLLLVFRSGFDKKAITKMPAKGRFLPRSAFSSTSTPPLKKLCDPKRMRAAARLLAPQRGSERNEGDGQGAPASRTLGGSAMRAALNSGPATPVDGVRSVIRRPALSIFILPQPKG